MKKNEEIKIWNWGDVDDEWDDAIIISVDNKLEMI